VAGPVEYSDTGALANLAPPLHANTQSAYVEERWRIDGTAGATLITLLFFHVYTFMPLHLYTPILLFVLS
jgi:hypothetical protein